MEEKKLYTQEEVDLITGSVYAEAYNAGLSDNGYNPKTGAGWVKASIVKVLEWAEKFHSENGDQLMLDDNEWYVTMDDEDEPDTRNCKSVTADDLAELYLMHHPDESGAPAADWAKDYDTLYYIVMPVLNKLRHRTDNDTRMMERGSEIRDTIHKVLADIKKLPPPISSNEPPFLVQSDVTPAAAREEDVVEFGNWLREQRADVFYGSPATAELYELFKQQK